ncbi:unnamed protein product, partial [Prorocentrum cordatum]
KTWRASCRRARAERRGDAGRQTRRLRHRRRGTRRLRGRRGGRPIASSWCRPGDARVTRRRAGAHHGTSLWRPWRIPRAARRQERAAAVLVEELIGTVGVPGCEDAVGIDTPWGDSCQAVAGECSDVEHGDQVRGLCPVTCGACGG